jgi:hypothetical protein
MTKAGATNSREDTRAVEAVVERDGGVLTARGVDLGVLAGNLTGLSSMPTHPK